MKEGDSIHKVPLITPGGSFRKGTTAISADLAGIFERLGKSVESLEL